MHRFRSKIAVASRCVLVLCAAMAPAFAQQAATDISIAKPSGQPAAPVRPRFRTLIDDDKDLPPPVPGVSNDAIQPAARPRTDTRTNTPGNVHGNVPGNVYGDVNGGTRDGARREPPERAQADGETEPPAGADLAHDGHIIVSEPAAPADGTEAFSGDPRLPEDRAAFLSPPAGYDNLAFQIELDPAADARTQRLARFQPYAPVGVRAGSWVIFPIVESGVTGTTNVYRSSNAKPDLIFDVRPTVLAVSDWQQHAVQFKATALGSAYDRFPAEADRAYAFEARGRLDITRQANIEMLASHSLDQESRFSTFAVTDAAKRTPYTTDKLAAAYNQRIGQVSVQVRSAITGTNYQAVPAYDGSLIDNTDRDLVARDVAVRAAWNFSPALAAFAETAANTQTYRAIPSDGIGRNSTGERVKVGLMFGSTSQIWRGEISTGYGHQHAADGRLQDADGVLLDANLTWRPTQITSVLFNAHTDFVTSTVAGEGNAIQRATGIELRHAFHRQLNGIASVSYQETDYQGLPLIERVTTGTLGLEYYLTRATTLLGSYQHSVVVSTAVATVNVDAVRVGVKWAP